MECNRSKKPCWYGVNCFNLRDGIPCNFYHPQEHRDHIMRQRNNQSNIVTQPLSNQSAQNPRPPTMQQYPNDPTTYATGGLNPRENRNPTNQYQNNRPSNYHRNSNYNRSDRNDTRNFNNNNTRSYGQNNQRPQQHTQNRPNQRGDQNSDRQRSRDLMNPNFVNRPQYPNQSPDYTNPRKNFRRQERRSPDYVGRPYDQQQNKKNQTNRKQVKPSQNQREIKMNFNRQEEDKIEEQTQNNEFNYQPDLSLQGRLHELFPSQAPQIDMDNFRREAQQAQDRIDLIRKQNQRRARQLRELRQRPGQRRYFYNQRLMQQNTRMIEQNRIQQEERDKFYSQFPTMDEVFGRNNRNQPQYPFNRQYDPFYDDDYEADNDNEQFSQEGESLIKIDDGVTQQNFHWFVQHSTYIDPRSLTSAQAHDLGDCSICLYPLANVVQPQQNQNRINCQNQKSQKIKKIVLQKRKKLEKKGQSQQNRNNEEELIMPLSCYHTHIIHKSCGVQWLMKQLIDVRKAQCPICRKDFRDHKEFAQYDQNYRERFMPVIIPENDQEDEQRFMQLDWRQQMNLLINRRLEPQIRNQRLMNVVDMIEERHRERVERRRRRRMQQSESQQMEQSSAQDSSPQQSEQVERQHNSQRRNIDLQHSQSMDSSYQQQEESRLYPVSQSESNDEQDMQSHENNERINPQKEKQIWEQYFNRKQPQSNPFLENQPSQQQSIDPKKKTQK